MACPSIRARREHLVQHAVPIEAALEPVRHRPDCQYKARVRQVCDFAGNYYSGPDWLPMSIFDHRIVAALDAFTPVRERERAAIH